MTKINQKTVVPFLYITLILIGIDMLTTVAGLKFGLEENNTISLVFINLFGTFFGFLVSIIGKCVIVIFPMMTYRYVEKELDTSFLKNVYWILYMGLIIIALLTTLNIDIKNIMVIAYNR